MGRFIKNLLCLSLSIFTTLITFYYVKSEFVGGLWYPSTYIEGRGLPLSYLIWNNYSFVLSESVINLVADLLFWFFLFRILLSILSKLKKNRL